VNSGGNLLLLRHARDGQPSTPCPACGVPGEFSVCAVSKGGEVIRDLSYLI